MRHSRLQQKQMDRPNPAWVLVWPTSFPLLHLVLASFINFACARAGAQDVCSDDAARYALIDLATIELVGGTSSDVNERGQVTGTAGFTEETARAFVWDCATGIRDIGTLPEVDYSSAGHKINNRGQILGRADDYDQVAAFLWDPSVGFQSLGSGIPVDLNDWGDALALSNSGGGGVTLWTVALRPRAFVDLSGYLATNTAHLNNLRQVGGYGYKADGAQFFSWGALRGTRDLGYPLPANTYATYDLNDRGDLLATRFTENSAMPLIVERNGNARFLGPTQEGEYISATSISNRRQVIGFSFTIGSPEEPNVYVWDTTHGFRDLNVLTFGHSPLPGEARITQVSAINEWGWIAASTRSAGGQWNMPALLVPIPLGFRHQDLLTRSGEKLCTALTALKLHALASVRRCEPPEVLHFIPSD